MHSKLVILFLLVFCCCCCCYCYCRHYVQKFNTSYSSTSLIKVWLNIYLEQLHVQLTKSFYHESTCNNCPSIQQWQISVQYLHVHVAGLSLRAITHNTCCNWVILHVCLIFPWCCGWNCMFLIRGEIHSTKISGKFVNWMDSFSKNAKVSKKYVHLLR